jgi:hypothetical protein
MTAESWNSVISRGRGGHCLAVAWLTYFCSNESTYNKGTVGSGISMWSAPRLYNDKQQQLSSVVSCEQWQFMVGHEKSPFSTAAT